MSSIKINVIKTFHIVAALLLISGFSHAQFLPNNKAQAAPLTKELLNRWIETNKTIRDYQKTIDEMLPTDAEAKAFEQLTSVEQDRIVNKYLQQKGMFEPFNSNMIKLGWTGVADYMRVSTQLGNAIAAHLQVEKVSKLPPEQAKAIIDRTDPAVKAVTKADLDFVRVNIATIRKHIMGYAEEK